MGAVVAPTTAGTATTVPRPHQGATPLPGRAAGASRRLRPSLRLPEVVFLPKNGTVSAFTKQDKDLHSRRSSHHMVQGRLHVMLHRRWSWGRFRFAYNGCKPRFLRTIFCHCWTMKFVFHFFEKYEETARHQRPW